MDRGKCSYLSRSGTKPQMCIPDLFIWIELLNLIILLGIGILLSGQEIAILNTDLVPIARTKKMLLFTVQRREILPVFAGLDDQRASLSRQSHGETRCFSFLFARSDFRFLAPAYGGRALPDAAAAKPLPSPVALVGQSCVSCR